MSKPQTAGIPKLQTTDVQSAPLSWIDIPEDRARAFDPDEAAALASLIAATGLQHPIRVRTIGNRYCLVSGLRRLEAVRLLGWTTIPLTVSTAATDDEARLEEVMENLARAELKKLDRCQHLYELKRVYERLHPEAKNGANGGVGGKRNENEIFAFSLDVAEKIGLSRRSIELAVKIWSELTPDSRARAVGTWLADHQAGLKQLSEQTPGDQAKILDLLFADPPRATNVPDALTIITNGRVKTHVEKKIEAINENLKKLPGAVANNIASAHVDARLAELQKSIATLSKFFGGLKDDELDTVVSEHEDRIIASLKRRGRI